MAEAAIAAAAFAAEAGAAAAAAASAVGSAAASAGAVLASPWVLGAAALGSAGLAVYSGYQQADMAKAQGAEARSAAMQADFAAKGELIAGQQEAAAVRLRLAQTLASQNARYAAAGIALDAGAPGDVARQTEADAETQTQILTANRGLAGQAQLIRAGQLRRQAGMFDREAGAAVTMGWLKAGTTLLQAGGSIAGRMPAGMPGMFSSQGAG